MTAKAKVKKKDKNVLFTYLSKENYEYVKAEATKLNRPATYFIEALVEAHRKKAEPVLEEKIPAYVLKARKWKPYKVYKRYY